MLHIDLFPVDAATLRRANALHKKQLQQAIAAVTVVEQSDATLRNQSSQLVLVTKQLEDAKEGFAHGAPGAPVTVELENPRRLVLCTSLHILRRAIDAYLEKGLELLGVESQSARRELQHVTVLLERLDDQTALELGYVAEKPVEITQEGIADIKAAAQQGIDEGELEPPPANGNKWHRRAKRGKVKHAKGPAPDRTQGEVKKRERRVVKEAKKREQDVVDENRSVR